MSYLSESEFIKKTKGNPYWKKGKEKRWAYMSYVIDILKEYKPEKILEAGTEGVPLNSNSLFIVFPGENAFQNSGIPHDLNQIPYPFKDKEFDFFVALQVWEHLENQIVSFNEVKRISKNIILSLPYKWHKKVGDCHNDIDDNVVLKWASDIEPTSSKQIGNRKVYIWLKIQ